MTAESPPVVDINCRICSYRILSYYLNCEIDPFSFDQLYYFQRYFIVFFEGENRSRKYLTDSIIMSHIKMSIGCVMMKVMAHLNCYQKVQSAGRHVTIGIKEEKPTEDIN